LRIKNEGTISPVDDSQSIAVRTPLLTAKGGWQNRDSATPAWGFCRTLVRATMESGNSC